MTDKRVEDACLYRAARPSRGSGLGMRGRSLTSDLQFPGEGDDDLARSRHVRNDAVDALARRDASAARSAWQLT